MVVPEIRKIQSPDVEGDLAEWCPGEPLLRTILLELTIGAQGDVNTALFHIVVATPEALKAQADAGRHVICDRGTMVVGRFVWDDIRVRLAEIVASCSGWSWDEVESKLRRYFFHEYEDYKP